MRRRSTKVLMIHVLRGWHVHLNSFKTIQDRFSSDWGLISVYVQLLVYVHICILYIWYMSYMLRCPKHLWPWQLRDTKISLFPPPKKKKQGGVPDVFLAGTSPKSHWSWDKTLGSWDRQGFDGGDDGHDVVHLFVGLTRLKVKKTHQEKMTMTKIP